MNLGQLCQIILKSDKEISAFDPLAQHAIFAYHMVRQTPLIALSPLRFPNVDKFLSLNVFLWYAQIATNGLQVFY